MLLLGMLGISACESSAAGVNDVSPPPVAVADIQSVAITASDDALGATPMEYHTPPLPVPAAGSAAEQLVREYRYFVPARAQWYDTRLRLSNPVGSNQPPVLVSASGVAQWAGGLFVGPDGLSPVSLASPDFLAPGLNRMALVGKVEDGPAQFLGVGPVEVRGIGTLRLGFNDNDDSDNARGFYATVQVTQRGDRPLGVCWDNGPFITHPTGGTGLIDGQPLSLLATDPDNGRFYGNVVRRQLPADQPDNGNRVGDDFRVGKQGCVVSRVETIAFRVGDAPDWTGAQLNIRRGSVTGPIVASATTTEWEFTGAYRTGELTRSNADRAIHRLIFSFPNVRLDAGTYWIDWQVVGGGLLSTAPYVMAPPSSPSAFDQYTVFGNGKFFYNGAWQALRLAPGAETPFIVAGPISVRR